MIVVGDTHVFPGFLTPVLTQLSFQSHWLLFSYASAEVRGENMPERNFASTGYRTHNHQFKSSTCSPLCYQGGYLESRKLKAIANNKVYFAEMIIFVFPKQALVIMCLPYKSFENTVENGEIAHDKQFLLFPQCFLHFWRTLCHFHQI